MTLPQHKADDIPELQVHNILVHPTFSITTKTRIRACWSGFHFPGNFRVLFARVSSYYPPTISGKGTANWAWPHGVPGSSRGWLNGLIEDVHFLCICGCRPVHWVCFLIFSFLYALWSWHFTLGGPWIKVGEGSLWWQGLAGGHWTEMAQSKNQALSTRSVSCASSNV